MNLPNKITVTRIMTIPVFLLFVLPLPEALVNFSLFQFIRPQLVEINRFISSYGHYIAAAIFIIAASTDGVDGYIARKRRLVTNLGKFLDPIADKLLIAAAIVALVQRGELNSWFAMIILTREFVVTGLRLIAAVDGIVISASNLGKIKTITQIIAIAAMLLKNFPISLFTTFPFDRYMMFIAVVITIYSGYDYFAKNIGLLDQSSK
jgi:CDP-diacylglycerol--glycerol-3-phosphate 3-phosphatidyltransferase